MSANQYTFMRNHVNKAESDRSKKQEKMKIKKYLKLITNSVSRPSNSHAEKVTVNANTYSVSPMKEIKLSLSALRESWDFTEYHNQKEVNVDDFLCNYEEKKVKAEDPKEMDYDEKDVFSQEKTAKMEKDIHSDSITDDKMSEEDDTIEQDDDDDQYDMIRNSFSRKPFKDPVVPRIERHFELDEVSTQSFDLSEIDCEALKRGCLVCESKIEENIEVCEEDDKSIQMSVIERVAFTEKAENDVAIERERYLLNMIDSLQKTLQEKDRRIKLMEDYTSGLLLRILKHNPGLLQNENYRG